MSKVKNIGIQFANGTVRMYLNEPTVELEIGKPDDTCPYRVKINGDTMECREIAKLIVDDWVVSYPDPYIKIPSIRSSDELKAWRSKLGLSAFSDIWRVVSDNSNDMIDVFSKAELKSDAEIEKAKKVIEMQVAKEMHDMKPKEEPKEDQKAMNTPTPYPTTAITDLSSGLVAVDKTVATHKIAPISYDDCSIGFNKEWIKGYIDDALEAWKNRV
jgi:hypothetical protein